MSALDTNVICMYIYVCKVFFAVIYDIYFIVICFIVLLSHWRPERSIEGALMEEEKVPFNV